MADIADRIVNGKRIVRVLAKDLTEEDRGKEFRCCGEGCNAQLVPRIGYMRQFFTCEPGYEGHVYGCEYKESYDSIREKNVSVLAKNAPDFSFNALFNELSAHSDKEKPVKPDEGSDAEQCDLQESAVQEKSKEKKTLYLEREVTRYPKNVKELIMLFTDIESLYEYGGVPVENVLVDGRSVSKYRKNGLLGTKIVIVKRGMPDANVKQLMERGDIYLVDAFVNKPGEKKLKLILKFENKAAAKNVYDQVYAKTATGEWRNASFAVWATWEETTIPGVYAAWLRTKKVFLTLKENEYRKI